MLVLWLGLGLWLVSGSSLVGVCRHLAAVVWSTYTTVVYTTVVSLVCRHDGRVLNINLSEGGFVRESGDGSPLPGR